MYVSEKFTHMTQYFKFFSALQLNRKLKRLANRANNWAYKENMLHKPKLGQKMPQIMHLTD